MAPGYIVLEFCAGQEEKIVGDKYGILDEGAVGFFVELSGREHNGRPGSSSDNGSEGWGCPDCHGIKPVVPMPCAGQPFVPAYFLANLEIQFKGAGDRVSPRSQVFPAKPGVEGMDFPFHAIVQAISKLGVH